MTVQGTAGLEDLAICALCGLDLRDGECVLHGRPGERFADDPGIRVERLVRVAVAAPPSWARRAGLAAAALAVVTALAVLATQLADARGDAARLRAAQRAAGLRARQADERVAAAEAAVNGLNRRVTELEAARDAVPDTAAVAQRVQRSVFTVETPESEGSGWVLAPGKVVTNFHVVAAAWQWGRRDVTLRQDDRTWPARIVEVAPEADLAVIDVDAPFDALLRAPERPGVGDPVLVVGSPLGLGGTVSSGIVSAFRTEEGLEYLQFSAPLSPGSSGGPVVDAYGRVVGVSVAKFVASGAEGLSFAIPADRLCAAIQAC